MMYKKSKKSWTRILDTSIAAEISELSRFCDVFIQLSKLKSDSCSIFSDVICPSKKKVDDLSSFITTPSDQTSLFFVKDHMGYHDDIQGFLCQLKRKLKRQDRVVTLVHNPYVAWVFRLVNFLAIRSRRRSMTFMTKKDLENIVQLSGFEITRLKMLAYCPFRLFGLGYVINDILPMIPFFRRFGLATLVILRPKLKLVNKPSLSIVIPARNERGNIEHAIMRMPSQAFGTYEVIFVEGHSTDGTWEEIQRIKERYKGKIEIRSYQQTGKGKANAVRLGFEKAKYDLFTILDADLTMPPEMLPRFYDAYCVGEADFINGSRFVYPMENQAMRIFNFWGNKFFATVLSFVLDTRISDALCGTKLLSRRDYARFVRWRLHFGDVDPFGDFELIFPASVLGLGIVDMPIRYRCRVYGTSNISRFRDGWMLFKMSMRGLIKIKSGRSSCRDMKLTTRHDDCVTS